MGKIVETFGKVIQDECDKNPSAARKLLLAGYHAQNLRWKTVPGKGGAAGIGGDYEFHDCAPGACRASGYGQSVYAL